MSSFNQSSLRSKEFSKSPWSLANILRSVDNFGLPIPSFNLKGKTHAKTWIGGLLTAMILTLTLAYAVQKLHAVFTGSDPTININIKAQHYDNINGIDLSEAN